MLHQLQKRKREEGFTIIEVLIVLAIAALILVVVLIAIPNLQRNQRNSARKTEASRILTAATNIVANNNGNPLTGTEAASIIGDVGTLQQYSGLTNGTSASTSLSANTVNVGVVGSGGSGTPSYSATSGQDALLILQNAKCGTTLGSYTYSNREIAIIYTLESGNGRTVSCIAS